MKSRWSSIPLLLAFLGISLLAPAEAPAGEPGVPPTKTKIILHGVAFDAQRGTIAAEAMPVLDEAVRILATKPGAVVIVAESSDGAEQSPLEPSRLRRAQSVRDYLAERGVSDLRVRARDTSGTSSAPAHASANDTAERPRVELYLD